MNPVEEPAREAADELARDDDRFRRAHQVRIRIPIEGGRTVEVDLTESPLRWLATRRDASGRAFLDPHELEAGERFRRDFALAGLTPRLGAALVTPVSGGRGPGAPDYSDLVLAARQRLRRVLDRVGPELGFVLMDVCGFLKGLEAVEQERGWPLRAGKVALKLALGALARAYGLAGTASGPDRSLGIRSWSEDGAPRPREVSRPARRGSAPSS